MDEMDSTEGYSQHELNALSNEFQIKPMGDEPMVIADAQGFRVTDAAGKDYLDGISGEWVVNLGYRHPEVAAAAIAQMGHADFIAPMYNAEPRALLAKKVVDMAPGMSKLLFGLSGSDAVEGAMHLAMRSTGKDEFVCLFQAYHGRTFATLALSYTYPSMYEGAKKGLERYTTRQIRVPNYNCYRCPFERTPDNCEMFCARFVEKMMVEGSEGGVAGVIVEAYQANGGMVPAPPGYLQEIREICTRQGAAMIVDEVQTAWGRCGEFFAVQHYGVEPDIIVLGKAFGGGFPMSGVLSNENFSELAAWEYGFTEIGHPVASAASLKMIEVMERDDLPGNARRMGERFKERLAEIEERHPIVGDVRVLGLMIAVELVRDRVSKEHAFEETAWVVHRCLERGLIVGMTGPTFPPPRGNVVKFKPAVNITETLVDDMCAIFDEVLTEAETHFGYLVTP
ncbi:aspartate aminotransferase family protein [Mycolicibacterium baixiangningiae]|uniref:aspartate aminotransferase family protein n=1 Tax=Mycolicibacterium baixiangningiae TaxID=2761578 RepID=UPI0018D0CADA|nr:aspartate aminotransferase family protein [Mycolicibacterium baixiangningiae]